MALRIAILDCHILLLDVADFSQRLVERRQGRMRRSSVEKPDPRHRRLLRARRERPRDRRAADQRDELTAGAHSITSSARASSIGGISMPSNLAVAKLMTSSNLVDRIIGMSAGFSPLRTRPV